MRLAKLFWLFVALVWGTSAIACPDITKWGKRYEITGPSLTDGFAFSVTAGGWANNAECDFGNATGNAGYTMAAPDFTFEASGMQGFELELRVVSECDSILLVNNGDSAWHYDDDGGTASDGLLRLAGVDGIVDVWVGTYDGDYCNAQLEMQTFSTVRNSGGGKTLPPPAVACPTTELTGQRYRATGDGLWSKRTYDIVAGGDVSIRDCPQIVPLTDDGSGFFTTPPDFTFSISGMAGYELEIAVESECDSALLINTASGSWYYDDDDRGNLDPLIRLTRPLDGRLDVWVGTYDGEYCNATLTMETFR